MTPREDSLPAHWTKDEAQRDRFLELVESVIQREAKFHAVRRGVAGYRDDIASEIRVELVEGMNGPSVPWWFALATPEETAQRMINQYRIRERARTIARRIAKKQSRQAQLLENVAQPTMPKDTEAQLMEIVRRIDKIAMTMQALPDQGPQFTSRDDEIFRLETCRQVGLEDLAPSQFDAAAEAAGLAPVELRTYVDDHEKEGHLSVRDRQAWGRAKAKVAATFTRVGLVSILAIIVSVGAAAAHQAL